ncbi:Y-family DNA polymerase [Bartonella apihabitans]|uniref:Y-family DNA polymerase n=1 Tax=Bartonella apihabitans TaxID=2750929 RepID=UPI003BB681DF
MTRFLQNPKKYGLNDRLYLALAFPRLPIDRLKTVLPPEKAPDFTKPFAVVSRSVHGLRLAHVNEAATHAGLYPGLSLVHARSLCERIETVNEAEEADKDYLQYLARNAGRFTPLVAYSLPFGLILDVTGCDHLFGGPQKMLEKVTAYYKGLGLETLSALTVTPAAARAFARFGVNRFVTKEDFVLILDRLKLPALEAKPDVQMALRRAGFYCLKDIQAVSPKALAARFGEVLPARLDALYGKRQEPLSFINPPPSLYLSLRLEEPLIDVTMVEKQFFVLAKEFFKRLTKLGLGCLMINIILYRVDGHIDRIGIETGRPLSDPVQFLSLLEERLKSLKTPLDAGYGYDTLALSVSRSAPLRPLQTELVNDDLEPAEIGQLVDRLSTRLGADHVLVAGTRESHIPEYAAFWGVAQHHKPHTEALKALDAQLKAQGFFPLRPNPPERPIRLFCPPQPIDVIAALPDDPPASFRWRRIIHKIRLAEGPERISAEWWKHSDPDRDYYRVEDENGERFWIFRYGEYPKTKWFLHGLFA